MDKPLTAWEILSMIQGKQLSKPDALSQLKKTIESVREKDIVDADSEYRLTVMKWNYALDAVLEVLGLEKV